MTIKLFGKKYKTTERTYYISLVVGAVITVAVCVPMIYGAFHLIAMLGGMR